MSRSTYLALALGLAPVLAAACSQTASERRDPPAPTGTAHVVILHTNDMHGQARPLEVKGEKQGGFAALAQAIARERESARKDGLEPLLVDAGDMWVGPLEGTRTEGAFVADFMNLLHYDLAAVGNHEFDHGPACVERLCARAHFPILGANVKETATNECPRWLAKDAHRTASGVEMRFVGLVTSDIREVTIEDATKGLDFDREEVAVERELGAASGPALTVLVTHCGDSTDRRLAERFHGRIAAIVGGHSHRPIDPAWHVPEGAPDAVLVAQTGARTANLGRIDLEIDRKTRRVVRSEGRLIPVRPANGEDPEVRALVDAEAKIVDELYGARIGELETALTREGLCSSLGTFIADRMREATGADAAFTNKGGLRADLAQGIVRLRHLHEVDPFGNVVVLMTFSGKELRELVEAMLDRGERHMFLEASGILVAFDESRKRGERVVSFEIGGRPLEPDRDYRIATNSFLAGGGDGHLGFRAGRDRKAGTTEVREIVRRYFEEKGRVAPGPVEARLVPVSH